MSVTQTSVLLFIFSVGVFGCAGPRPANSEIDVIAGRAVSDSVMVGLVHNRVELVLERMEPAFLAALGRTGGEAAIGKLIDYCGRPLDVEFESDEERDLLDATGGHRRVHTFKYATKTTQKPGESCIWSVDVVGTGDGLRVAYVRAGHKVDIPL